MAEKMFNITKTGKGVGECPARRCSAPSAALESNPHALCERHHNVWVANGCPDLTAPSATAIVPASSSLEAELEQQREAARGFFVQVRENVQITEQSHMDAAGAVLAAIKVEKKRLTDIMSEHLTPLKDNLKKLERFFKAPIEYLESAEKDVKEKIKTFELRQREAQDRALAEVQRAGLAQDVAEETTLTVAHGVVNLALPQGVSTREKWAFRVTDPASVVRELCCPDTDLIGRLVKNLPDDEKVRIMRECGGVLTPGIELIRDLTVVNGT